MNNRDILNNIDWGKENNILPQLTKIALKMNEKPKYINSSIYNSKLEAKYKNLYKNEDMNITNIEKGILVFVFQTIKNINFNLYRTQILPQMIEFALKIIEKSNFINEESVDEFIKGIM